MIGSLRGLSREISAEVAFLINALRVIVSSGLGLSVLTSTVYQRNFPSLSLNVMEAVYTPPSKGVIYRSYLKVSLGLTINSGFP